MIFEDCYGIEHNFTPPSAGPVLIACPTRSRLDLVERMARKFHQTSTTATLVFYVDSDQTEEYRVGFTRERHPLWADKRVHAFVGPRIGMATAVNRIVQCFGSPARIYGMWPDDSYPTVEGWDAALENAFDSMKKRIGTVSMPHSCGDYDDIVFASRELMDFTSGNLWDADVGHFCGPTMLEMLGDKSQFRRLDPERAFLNHEAVPTARDMNPDLLKFGYWCIWKRHEIGNKLREAINA